MKNNILWISIVILLINLVAGCSGGGSGDDDNRETPGTTGTISGVIRDAQTRDPVPNAQIVITDEDGNDVANIATNATGEYTAVLDTGILYSLLVSVTGYIPATYFNIEVLPNVNNILQTILQIDLSVSTGAGSISGTILDAVTGDPVSGATLRLRPGINVQTGPFDEETTTDVAGIYVLTDALPAGYYTCEISLSGYATTYISIIVLGGMLVGDQNSAISPALNVGETRIVLTWGIDPSDVDSHLTGPVSDNSIDRFHVYWLEQIYPLVPAPDVGLDVDDITSFGPETITIVNQHQGTYRYSVHDYTNGAVLGTPNSMGLANSGARVEVLRAGEPTLVFNVPNLEGTLWTVFEMNGSSISPINTMSDESDSSMVLSVNGNSKSDIELVRNLPLK